MGLLNNPYLEQIGLGVEMLGQNAQRQAAHKRQLEAEQRQLAERRRQELRQEQRILSDRQFGMLSNSANNRNLTPESRQQAASLAARVPALGMLDQGFTPQFQPSHMVRINPKDHKIITDTYPSLSGQSFSTKDISMITQKALTAKNQRSRTASRKGQAGEKRNTRPMIQAVDDRIKELQSQLHDDTGFDVSDDIIRQNGKLEGEIRALKQYKLQIEADDSIDVKQVMDKLFPPPPDPSTPPWQRKGHSTLEDQLRAEGIPVPRNQPSPLPGNDLQMLAAPNTVVPETSAVRQPAPQIQQAGFEQDFRNDIEELRKIMAPLQGAK